MRSIHDYSASVSVIEALETESQRAKHQVLEWDAYRTVQSALIRWAKAPSESTLMAIGIALNHYTLVAVRTRLEAFNREATSLLARTGVDKEAVTKLVMGALNVAAPSGVGVKVIVKVEADAPDVKLGDSKH